MNHGEVQGGKAEETVFIWLRAGGQKADAGKLLAAHHIQAEHLGQFAGNEQDRHALAALGADQIHDVELGRDIALGRAVARHEELLDLERAVDEQGHGRDAHDGDQGHEEGVLHEGGATLGVAEAGFFPGIILYLTYWFPAAYRARIIAVFMVAIPISLGLGAPLSTGIMELNGMAGLKGWQWLFLLEGDAKYVDVMERTLFNGLVSGVSLDGKTFFYPNPLESNGQHARQEWFGVACCPGNITRFMASFPGYMYAHQGKTLFVNLYAAGTATSMVIATTSSDTSAELRKKVR